MAGHDLAGGETDVCPDRAPDLIAQLPHSLLDREGGTRRPLGVVAVRNRRPEHRHDAVADVLVDAAAKALDDAIDPLEEPLQQSVDPSASS